MRCRGGADALHLPRRVGSVCRAAGWVARSEILVLIHESGVLQYHNHVANYCDPHVVEVIALHISKKITITFNSIENYYIENY